MDVVEKYKELTPEARKQILLSNDLTLFCLAEWDVAKFEDFKKLRAELMESSSR